MSRRRVAEAAAVAVAIVLAAGAAIGHATEPFEVEAGFGGRWRVGSWTPLVVSARGEGLEAGQPVRVWAEDDDGQFVATPPAVATSIGERVEARLCVRFGRPSGRYRVEIDGAASGSRPLEDRLVEPIASTDHVIATYGDLPSVARAARLLDRDRGGSTAVVAATPPYGTTARCLDAADAIVVTGSAAAALPAAARAGIDAWVRGGGRLVFVSGASAAEVASGGSPLTAWLPGAFDRVVRLKRLGPIEAYARAGGLVDRVPPDGVAVPRFVEPIAGAVLVSTVEAGGGPVVVRFARGLGTITWIGVDLDADPFRGWSGCDTLLAAALGGRSRGGLDSRSADRDGMPDLAGQLHAALDSFAASAGSAAGPGDDRSASPVPFELIAGLGLLYVLCLYPLDWWLVSKLARPWLAWLTLPILAAAFTAAAAGLTARWGAGRSPIARAADVIDVDAASGQVRGTAWLGVRSPANGRLDVRVAAPPALVGNADDAAVSWWGMAGRGFGGIDAAVPHPSLASSEYGYEGSLDRLAAVPIAAAASRLFEAEWSGRAAEPVVRSSLAVTGQATLTGTMSHQLPFALEQCRLLHAGWLYDVGTLRPGDRYDTATGRGPRSLASALTRRAAARDRESAARWDPAIRDVARILEVAAFHGAAGGPDYTGLDAGRLGRLDLSPLLGVDRAVLLGSIVDDRSMTGWSVGGSGGTVPVTAAAPTICRIVIPIATEAAP